MINNVEIEFSIGFIYQRARRDNFRFLDLETRFLTERRKRRIKESVKWPKNKTERWLGRDR